MQSMMDQGAVTEESEDQAGGLAVLGMSLEPSPQLPRQKTAAGESVFSQHMAVVWPWSLWVCWLPRWP